MSVSKVTFWSCPNIEHRHKSRKEAEICETPLRGDELVQGLIFEIGEKFFDYWDSSIPGFSVTIWVITDIEIVECYSRPDESYKFERAVYTLVGSRGGTKTVPAIFLKNGPPYKVRHVKRALRRHFRNQNVKLETEKIAIYEAIGREVARFNPTLGTVKYEIN